MFLNEIYRTHKDGREDLVALRDPDDAESVDLQAKTGCTTRSAAIEDTGLVQQWRLTWDAPQQQAIGFRASHQSQ
jgi:hypothetical protein